MGRTGIGAISLDGTKLLVGEANGPHIVLIDISKPPSAAVVSTIFAGDFADGGISAIVLQDSTAIASGFYNFDVLNYAHPSKPVVTPYVLDASNPTSISKGRLRAISTA